MGRPDDRDLIDDQNRSCRARATEYDETSPNPEDDTFAADAGRVREALRVFAPRGRVLELAAGTLRWTCLLADFAGELVVTDASPEVLELNRPIVGKRDSTRYEVVDAFGIEPAHAFDTVFFGFFLSHVPLGQFEPLWALLEGLLAPGGRVFRRTSSRDASPALAGRHSPRVKDRSAGAGLTRSRGPSLLLSPELRERRAGVAEVEPFALRLRQTAAE